jgi:tyrosyl-tRNA synthetase
MGQFFRLVTKLTPPEISSIEDGIKSGKIHPRDAKMKLAREIVSSFYGENAAAAGEKDFIATFQKGEIPEDIPTHKLSGEETIVDILVAAGLAGSRSDARRLIDQKGVRLDGNVIDDPAQKIENGGILKVGRRHFLRVE